MERKHLYIILVRTNTVISRLIQFAKRDEYTHAAISLDERLGCMYSFGRKYAYFPFIGRFKREQMDRGLYGLQKSLPGIVMEVEVSEKQYNKVKNLLDSFVLNDSYYKYNYLGLVYGLFNMAACCDNRFTCSEFVYYILHQSGITDLKTPGNLVRPQNLLNIRSKVVFEGNLKDFEPQANYLDSNNTVTGKIGAVYG